MKTKDWKDLWEYRADKYSGESAAIIGGFDSGRGKITKRGLNYLIKRIKELLNLDNPCNLLEIGCGAGLILENFNSSKLYITGVDYSPAMVRLIKQRIPQGKFYVSEAAYLPFKESIFDRILVWSVFQYFPSLKYAQNAMSKMLRCLRNPGKILLGDIPDLEKYKDARILESSRPHAKNEFKPNNKLVHQYYSRSFFYRFAKKYDCNIEILDLNVPDYLNSKVRFTVLLKVI